VAVVGPWRYFREFFIVTAPGNESYYSRRLEIAGCTIAAFPPDPFHYSKDDARQMNSAAERLNLCSGYVYHILTRFKV
jgi:hypothetical protein